MNARNWLEKAKSEKFAIGAFNVDNLEIFKAVVAGALAKKSPVMMEFSDGEVKFLELNNIVDLVKNAEEEYGINILLNLDHSPDQAKVEEAIEAGFELIHYDGSKTPYEENVEICKAIIPKAHEKGLTVEGEIDHIAGSSNVHKEQITFDEIKEGFTKPEKAKEFVTETGVDIFAAFFGNVHGVYPVQPSIDIDLLKKIREAFPDTFLSMHGGSGISDSEVRQAIEIGKIVKINVNTEMRKAFREGLEKALKENPDEYAVYKIMPDVISGVQKVVEHKIDVFGSAGKI
ncbi:class II fructose-bisphosphate aldolase [Patescibacteria group bacterium]|nr:class II fructose-bisphosphate aldolase [Patescibacteria group bacterium]